MTKLLRVVFILVLLAALFIPTLRAITYAAKAQIDWYVTDSLAKLLGVNLFLIQAGVTLSMPVFYFALRLLFSLDSTKQRIGSGILAAFIVLYKLGLYHATRDLHFTFRDGTV